MCEIDVKKLRERLGLSQTEFAGLLGVHLRTVQNYEKGGEIPASRRAILHKIEDGNITQTGNNNHAVTGGIVYGGEQIEELKRQLAEKDAQIAALTRIIENLSKK